MLGRKAKKAPVDDSTGATFPLTGIQAYMLRQLMHPDCIDAAKEYFMLTEGLRVTPPGSPRRLERAVKKIAKKHDILRGTFVQQEDGEWVLKIIPADDITLDVTDYGEVSREEMYEIISKVQSELIPADAPKLTEFRLLRFGSLGDVTLIRVHHMLTDGYGILVMVEDLVKSILNLPGTSEPMTHAEYIQNHLKKLPPYDGKVKAYWDAYLENPPQPIPFGRHAKGGQVDEWVSLQEVRQSELPIPKDEYEAITEKVIEGGGSFFSLIATALGQALYDLYGSDDYIGRYVASRNTADLSRYTGPDLQWFYFRSKISDGANLVERSAVLRKDMTEADSHRCADLDVPYGEVCSKLVEGAGSLPQVFLHIATATGRAKASLLSRLLEAEGSETFKVGPVEVERLALPRPKINPVSCDISVLVTPTSNSTVLKVRADADALEIEEMDAIVAKMVEHIRGVLT